jgi:hypothetical protein
MGYLNEHNARMNAEKSVYEHVAIDSAVEWEFADQLEKNNAVKVYAKLPSWFKVPTPLGSYNPDWAVLVERDGTERLYFVVETKSSLFDEDLRDREELRAAARVAIARNWSVFGSGVFNLTDPEDDPIFMPDGFEPIRTRLGFAYQDDTMEFGATWRRDFVGAGDATRGNTFQVFFALRNLGFR